MRRASVWMRRGSRHLVPIFLGLSAALVACDDDDDPLPDETQDADGSVEDAEPVTDACGPPGADGSCSASSDGGPEDAEPVTDACGPPGADGSCSEDPGDAEPVTDACGPPGADGSCSGDDRVHIDPDQAHCDPLSEGHCLYPWPSDRWLVADDTTQTGFRVAYEAQAMPQNNHGKGIEPEPFNGQDGFSPGAQLLALFAQIPDLGDFGGPDQIERSTAPGFPTALIDLESGEAIPHWIELDARAPEGADEVALLIRPATRLRADRRYGVAVRGLSDREGAPLEPSTAFAALRDGEESDSPSLEARRARYELLFDQLEAAGFERDSLQLAWWFQTGSDEDIRSDLLQIRDDAVARLGEEGLGCTVIEVEEDFRGSARRVRGTVTAPWYLTAEAQPSPIGRDGAGRPVRQEDREVPFTAIVPSSLHQAEAPGPLIVWGHGLFGQADEDVSGAGVVQAAEAFQQVIVGTDWIGMSQSDLGFLATALIDVSKFTLVGERLTQAMVNFIALERSLPGVCAGLPAFENRAGGSSVAAEAPYFIGGSQGSILGGTYLTLSPSVQRGALVVGGSGFSFMIERSIHYNTFELLLNPSYPRRLDTALIMSMSQQVWDKAESDAWVADLQTGLEGVGPKQALYIVAENDAQVPNLASHRAARLMDLPVLEGSAHQPWGTQVVASPHQGSVYLSLDYGDRPTPEGNLAPQVDDGGHVNAAFTPLGMQLISEFLLMGEITADCEGVCRVGPAAE